MPVPFLEHWSVSIPFLMMVVVGIPLWYVVFLHPIVRIVQRTGRSGWAVLWIFVPVANIVALQVLAYGRWPALDKNRDSH
jgi:hypothetical protein